MPQSASPQISELTIATTQRDQPPRFVTAASLFDGHDASINIMRRMLQSAGAEVIHLGHNRSVEEVATAALQEDAHAVAVSSYQGGHVEYFRYLVEVLTAGGGADIRVFGGGGGVIIPEEIAALQAQGVTRIYSPQDGQTLGLQGIIDDMLAHCDSNPAAAAPTDLSQLRSRGWRGLAQLLSAIENIGLNSAFAQQLGTAASAYTVPVLGITGTGGAGKSSLTDELIRRFRLDSGDRLNIAVLAVDPSRRKTGGALLGDRIRMNALDAKRVFMRSLATRDARGEVPSYLSQMIEALKLGGFDLIIVETPGIGQGDTGIAPLADCALYVMTPEFGAASQLEKIDMLDYADVVAINKFDRRGAADALRDVRKQVQRNQQAFSHSLESMPVYGTMAARFNDDGTTALYQMLKQQLSSYGLPSYASRLPHITHKASSDHHCIIPVARQRYLAEIADTVHAYRDDVAAQAVLAREIQQLKASKFMLGETLYSHFDQQIQQREQLLHPANSKLLADWPTVKAQYQAEEFSWSVRGREILTPLKRESLSGTSVSRVALPHYSDHGDLLRWLKLENLPGQFPFTAGVFMFKREGEEPTRMFAGEGDAFKTNRRFKKLSEHAEAKRLSTAFDSVTLYGADPEDRPDIYGKIGNSGVSIASLTDMQALYNGFDLCDPKTSVSMTINGPAPAVLAMFLNTAITQKIDAFHEEHNRAPTPEEQTHLKATALTQVRGTVQADILKEDQGQNTCIFSTEFSLKLMGDIQEYFITNGVKNFYSVSISGYHIAEAGANPISQLAFTLANGFTYVEAYLARGMQIDDFAPNLSFFFSNGMDPEYSVLGRVARRIWAITMREKYGANEISQKLKYHVQTSGRSLHAQEISFNDIRTTLQALIAVYDNCNSLHTNAYDEAITTPTEESVRRALAIQLIISREWGLAYNENPQQGAFIIDELTDLVEAAVLDEFQRIAARGGVLGAMETGYQRGKIQDESLLYEHKKHDGSLPIIGVNTFLGEAIQSPPKIALARSSEAEKQSQIRRVKDFQQRDNTAGQAALQALQDAAMADANIFAVLMETVKYCSLGQITGALFTVGGQYRRSM